MVWKERQPDGPPGSRVSIHSRARSLLPRAWHGCAPAWSVVLEDASGNLLAHVGIVDRTVSVGRQSYRIGGVQNVFVLPQFRGRGLVDQVMAASMDEARRREFDCGLLFCVPELEKVYGRCGWKKLPEVPVVRVEEGKELPLPGKNIAMSYPLVRGEFPGGTIHLRGNDW